MKSWDVYAGRFPLLRQFIVYAPTRAAARRAYVKAANRDGLPTLNLVVIETVDVPINVIDKRKAPGA